MRRIRFNLNLVYLLKIQNKDHLIYALLIAFLLLVISYYYELKPRILTIASLYGKQRQLQDRLITISHLPEYSAKRLPQTSNNRLERFLRNAYFHHIDIHRLHIEQINTADIILTLTATAKYDQISALITNILNKGEGLIVNFDYRLLPQHLIAVNLRLMMFFQPLVINHPQLKLAANPFCGEQHVLKSKAYSEKTSITMFRLAGFIRQGSFQQAFVTLPDKTIMAISKNMYVGKEHALITAIKSDHVDVVLPNKKKWKLK